MRFRTTLASLLLVALSTTALADDSSDRSADDSAIRQVTQAFITTRDNNDEAGLRAILTEDCDQRLTSGRTRIGRDAVVAGALQSTSSSGGTRVIALETIRYLGDDVAIANGSYNSLGRADGTDLYMRTTMIFQRVDGKWLIAAIRNARKAEES